MIRMIIDGMLTKFSKFKVYYSTASFYLSTANFLMILATTKLLYGINISVMLLIPLVLTIMTFLGYLDYKLISPRTIEHVNQKNDMKHQLDRIEKKLERLQEDYDDTWRLG